MPLKAKPTPAEPCRQGSLELASTHQPDMRGGWFWWLRTYLSKWSIDGKYRGWIALPIYAFVVWVYPPVIGLVPFGLSMLLFGVLLCMEQLVVLNDAEAPLPAKLHGRLLRAHGSKVLAVLGLGLLYVGFCTPYYAAQAAAWAEARGMDGPATEAVLVMASLTLMTIVLAITMIKIGRTTPFVSTSNLMPSGKRRRSKSGEEPQLTKQMKSLIQYRALVAKQTNLAHECAWLFLTVTIALIPAAFTASIGPNLVAGFLFPLLVTHAREDYRKFRTSAPSASVGTGGL